MGTSTPNFGLFKADSNDNVIVLTNLANNWDIIDTELDRLGDMVNSFGVGSGTWVVSWTARDGSAPVIGNGKLVGQYIKIGKFVYYWIYQKMGSTSTYGSVDNNAFQWSLPFASRNVDGELGTVSENVWGGSAYAFDSGVANRVGTVNIKSNSSIVTAVSDGSIDAWSRNLPQVWVNGDPLRLHGWYEAA